MHLAVLARHAAVGIINHRRIMVQTCRTALKQRGHQHDAAFTGHGGIFGSHVTGYGDGQIKVVHTLHLAKVERVVQLGQYHELGSLGGKLPDFVDEQLAVSLHVAAVVLLDDSYLHILVGFKVCVE